MAKSIGRKKKRKFYTNRFSNTAVVVEKENVECTASSSKLVTSSPPKDEESDGYMQGNRIFDLEILSNLFNKLSCPSCYANELFLSEETVYGLCSHFTLKCNVCDFCEGFASSKKLLNASEINNRFVYGMRQIGKGFSAAYKLCATLNLPPLSKTAYVSNENKLLKVVKDVAEKSMKKAANDVIEKKNNVLNQPDEVIKCGVSVDGTWQRRGYTSMNGCVAAISVDTGKVLDLEVMSSYCPTCKKLDKMPKSTIEYKTLKADHVCQCNFKGSSAKMETVGASRIFSRSIKNRALEYTEYYGDGDSKAFMNVKDTYGENSVVKLECIGHIQKRVGSRLRKLKTTTKGLSGRGKLTDAFIDRLQNYYGIAIRSNVGNLAEMQKNVIAALFHCASSANKPMHGQCPTGKNSWCYFQRSLSAKLPVKEKYAGLPNNVLNVMKPVYMNLCSKELLSKCLHGLTQNANECFNGIIWQRVPKEVFVCLKTVKLGAYDAAIQFNGGYNDCLNVLSGLGIKNYGYFTTHCYKHLDNVRIKDSIRHSTPSFKKRRKILRAIRKNKISALDCKDGDSYKSGAY